MLAEEKLCAIIRGVLAIIGALNPGSAYPCWLLEAPKTQPFISNDSWSGLSDAILRPTLSQQTHNKKTLFSLKKYSENY